NLQGISIASDLTTADLVDRTFQYGTPFPGFTTAINSKVRRNRSIHGVDFEASTHYYTAITNSTTCTTYADPGGAAIPIEPKLAGTRLATDDIMIGLPSAGPIELTWDLEATSVAPTNYFIMLERLDSSAWVTVRTMYTID